eukprot:SAG31_NODE_700_length_12734_cov_212.705105_7_plen_74_part_00
MSTEYAQTLPLQCRGCVREHESQGAVEEVEQESEQRVRAKFFVDKLIDFNRTPRAQPAAGTRSRIYAKLLRNI